MNELIILDKTIKKVSPDIFKAVEKEVLYFQNEFVGSDDLILQDDIFRVLENIEDLSIIMFPVEDEDFCGFLFEYRGENFIYINTFLPFEKQIFTAALELYHYLVNGKREFLDLETIDEDKELDLEESKANLFAALLLVPKDVLNKQLNLLKIKKSADLTILKIIKLMDIFAVPFKTIILRLFEIELLTEKETRDWLDIAARNPEKGILYQIKKHKIGERWQKRTKHVKLSNLKALIIDNDEMELLPEEKINKDLSFLAEVDVDEE